MVQGRKYFLNNNLDFNINSFKYINLNTKYWLKAFTII